MATIDLAYDTDPLCRFDVHPPPTTAAHRQPLLCFVHGGAWKSYVARSLSSLSLVLIARASDDKAFYAPLARSLARATNFPVAVPNYRLTPSDNLDPAFHHPLHALDILNFLSHLRSMHSPPYPFDPDNLILLGHSCSAHMLSSIFLSSDLVTPQLTPHPTLLAAVKGIVLSEGIYDIDLLLQSFPSYRSWFIQPTFGTLQSYDRLSVTNYPSRPSSTIRWLLLHSKRDTLVDVPQTEAMYAHLSLIFPQGVSLNVDDLVEEHDAILQSLTYKEIVVKFVEMCNS